MAAPFFDVAKTERRNMNNFENVIKTSYEQELIRLINSKSSDATAISSPEEIWTNIHRLASEGTNFGEPYRYLSLNVKKMLAYIADPNYRIEYHVENTDETSTVEALFYWSGETVPAGVGFVKRHISQIFRNDSITSDERKTYLESSARGMAASRAITDAGIGLQFYSDLFDRKFEEMEALESSLAQERNNSAAPVTTTTDGLPVIPTHEEKKAARYKAAGKKASVEKENKADAPATETATTPKTEEVKTEVKDDKASEQKDTTVETQTAATCDLETAKKAICDIGSYAGNPLGAVYGCNPRNLIWLINHGSSVAAEARVIVESDPELKSYLK